MTARPLLVFGGEAAEALAFWEETIPAARIEHLELCDAEGPGREGEVRCATLSLDGMKVLVSDGVEPPGDGITPAMSFFITCASEAEIEMLARRLGEGGRVLMPLGDHGFSRKFAWVEDRYHVSWQLNLP